MLIHSQKKTKKILQKGKVIIDVELNKEKESHDYNDNTTNYQFVSYTTSLHYKLHVISSIVGYLNSRTIGYESRSFEPRSSDEDDTAAHIPFPKLPHQTNERTLSSNIFNVHQPFYTMALQWQQVSNPQLDNARL
ncbi:hypothetical protein TNCV_1180231 [Trichonephila clavipes]|nr:hypothetical protein TNCV_1180231 [Trichonephila clavipes]